MELNKKQENLIRSLISGRKDYSSFELKKRFESLQIPFKKGAVVVEISVENYTTKAENIDDLMFNMQEFVSLTIEKSTNSFCCLINDYGNLQVIFFEPFKELDKFLVELAQSTNNKLDVNVFIGIGKEIQTITEFPLSATYAHQLMQYKYQYKDDSVVDSKKLQQFYDNEGIKYTDIYDKVINDFLFGDLTKMSTSLSELAESVRQRPIKTKNSIRRSLCEIAIRIVNLASYAGINVDEVLNDVDPYTYIMKQRHTEKIISWIVEISAKLIEASTGNRLVSTEKTSINRAVAYIDENLSNSHLSLDEISSYLKLSSPYVSALFKSNIGVGIADYIANQRILKAKKMLIETTLKIKDIAIAVGFNDVGYFNMVFKRKTGMTPNEFRKGY